MLVGGVDRRLNGLETAGALVREEVARNQVLSHEGTDVIAGQAVQSIDVAECGFIGCFVVAGVVVDDVVVVVAVDVVA